MVGAADFNGDGKPDYVNFNPTTLQTVVWYMNNNVYLSLLLARRCPLDGDSSGRPILTATAKMITSCSIRARGNRQSGT